MKIFTTTQIKELDKYTIEHEPISSIDLMERAAKAIAHAIMEEYAPNTPIVVFAGHGNNGGDALAVARMLFLEGYDVQVVLFNISNELSEECSINRQRLLELKSFNKFTEVTVTFDPPELTKDTLVIDGLFGSGLNKPLAGGFATLVRYINQSPSKVVSIDIPSGLMAEDNSYNVTTNIIKADLTLTLHQPKLSFMFAETQQYIGKLKTLDIRLNEDFITNTPSDYQTIEENDLIPFIKTRGDFAHKGQMGNALLIAGAYGMGGAALLATKACLRSGVGKATIHTTTKNYNLLQLGIPEAIFSVSNDTSHFTQAIDSDQYDALGIGPGIGTDETTAIATISQIRRTGCPIVIDADAINILATKHAWLQQLPRNVIMTPHPLEFDRLCRTKPGNDYERLSMAREMAKNLHAYIILKGHRTAICYPDGRVFFNPTGNSGMATAGSGDVLTGILTGLLARGYKHEEACLLGVFLHGLAGDIAIKDIGKESLLASDLIDYLPKAIKRLSD